MSAFPMARLPAWGDNLKIFRMVRSIVFDITLEEQK
jgi:hypothetical protein